jgi:hypothetical protein
MTPNISRDDARDVFRSLGLTYESVLNDKCIGKLVEFLDEAFDAQRKAEDAAGKPHYWKKVIKSTAKPRKDSFGRKTKVCFIEASGDYFDARECVSFNANLGSDGMRMIGFCGAAGDDNASVVTSAFVKWCDWVSSVSFSKIGRTWTLIKKAKIGIVPGTDCPLSISIKKGTPFIENVFDDGIFLAGGGVGIKFDSETAIIKSGIFSEGDTEYHLIKKGTRVRFNQRYIDARPGGCLYGKAGTVTTKPEIVNGEFYVSVDNAGPYKLRGLSPIKEAVNAEQV